MAMSVFRDRRGPVLIAIMLSSALMAVDATVLATAVPSIVADLGEFSRYPWLFSGYLLAQAVTVPVFSRLADTYGRKPVILTGIGVFVLGSALAVLAPSMTVLILCRIVQGIGAGAVQPMGQTIAGDIYTVRERAKVQGYLASVWALSSMFGPLIGGLFSQYVSWRWIFVLNVPLGLLAATMVWRNFHEQVERTRHRIDVEGALVLTLALTLLLLGLLEGGEAWAWNSTASLVCFLGGAAALVLFVFIERHAAEPVVNLRLLSRRLIVHAVLISAAIGGIVLGLTSFVPTYLERAAGATPVAAGIAVAALTIAWPLASANAGRIYVPHGFRASITLGSSIVMVGAVLLLLVVGQRNIWLIVAVALVLGAGLGFTAAPNVVAAQSSVGWSERAEVTGLTMFARSAGSAVAVAVYGTISNAVIGDGDGATDPATVVDATTGVFYGVVGAALLLLVAAWTLPRQRRQPEDDGQAGALR
ncbi:MFS transporter [Corynebacterium kalidii]|uniref:MFS transporter n=1 Tax=Corynebacterium kalidii TaxID=2931982 RepID=A0A9X1WJC9_9CORY|nr:MFS transporter [Corynebacterium kalidii]MCJ7858475.1 MFS transporter [Corynebacterium kalidii]